MNKLEYISSMFALRDEDFFLGVLKGRMILFDSEHEI